MDNYETLKLHILWLSVSECWKCLGFVINRFKMCPSEEREPYYDLTNVVLMLLSPQVWEAMTSGGVEGFVWLMSSETLVSVITQVFSAVLIWAPSHKVMPLVMSGFCWCSWCWTDIHDPSECAFFRLEYIRL